MNIQEILNHSSNVSFTVTGNDLLLFADHLIKLSLAAAEKSNAHKKSVAYLTPNEVCKQLKVARSTLCRWDNTNYLTPIEVGGKRLYKQTDIDALLQK